jgi:hypothetical protein
MPSKLVHLDSADRYHQASSPRCDPVQCSNMRCSLFCDLCCISGCFSKDAPACAQTAPQDMTWVGLASDAVKKERLPRLRLLIYLLRLTMYVRRCAGDPRASFDGSVQPHLQAVIVIAQR